MLVNGTETRSIKVEVSPLEIVKTLLDEELYKIGKSPFEGYNYDTSHLLLREGNTLVEVCVKHGYSGGHYDIEDKVVREIDRTGDVSESLLLYLHSLRVVRDHLKGEG